MFLQVVDDPLHKFHGITAAASILNDQLNKNSLSAGLISFQQLRRTLPEFSSNSSHHILIHYEPGFYCESIYRRIWNRLRINIGFFFICSILVLARKPFLVVVHEFYPISTSRGALILSRVIDTFCLKSAACIIVSQEWLRSYLSKSTNRPVHLLPVFSNIPDPPVTDCESPSSLVFFGSPGSLHRFLSNSHLWSSILHQFSGNTFTILCSDIAPCQISNIKASFPFLNICCYPGLDSSEVSRLLSQSRLGIVDYSQASSPPDSFAKSGVLAAFHQHGVSPIVLASNFDFYGVDPLSLSSGKISYCKIDVLRPWIVNSLQLANTYQNTTSVAVYSEVLLSLTEHINSSR